MGYLHIDNLYAAREILLFKKCVAMEKIHGTSARIKWAKDKTIHFFSGGASHNSFEQLFNRQLLTEKLKELFPSGDITVFGEAYGGKMQGMSDTYGKELKFIAFDVKIGDIWLSVANAEDVCKKLGIEFVYYEVCSTEIEELDKQRNKNSTQAIRNGLGEGKASEGVILRPLIELTKNNGSRLICKYKREEFRETKTARPISDEELKIISDAQEVAEEWVTPMRLEHVLQKIEGWNDMRKMPMVISAMIEDVEREGAKEITISKAVKTAIGKKAAKLFKDKIQHINDNQ